MSSLIQPWPLPHQGELSILLPEHAGQSVSGNKLHKLKYHLQNIERAGSKTVLSFGGAHSNHLHALSAACRQRGWRLIAVVRGDADVPFSPTLQDLRANNDVLHFVARSQWPAHLDDDFLQSLRQQYGEFYLVPDGGGGEAGLRGCIDWGMSLAEREFDSLLLSLGTGTTAIGLRLGLDKAGQSRRRLYVVPAFNGWQGFSEPSQRLAEQYQLDLSRIRILQAQGMGAFARPSKKLREFWQHWHRQPAAPQLDVVYSLRAAWLLQMLAENGESQQMGRVLYLHGGGLQGNRAYHWANAGDTAC